jgi:hypothetical protein
MTYFCRDCRHVRRDGGPLGWLCEREIVDLVTGESRRLDIPCHQERGDFAGAEGCGRAGKYFEEASHDHSE